LIQEVFLETDWDEAAQALAARDERASQLEAEGMTCSCTTLYRITDGRRVFLVEAQSPEDLEAERQPSRRNSSSRRPRKDKGPNKIEYR
jgi:RES domain-containing protein